MRRADFEYAPAVEHHAHHVMVLRGLPVHAAHHHGTNRVVVDAVDEVTHSNVGDRSFAIGRGDWGIR
jgi:putative NIF3 family GTP cyclohydrolase 1 type 2